jgi:hypothetical protein
MLLTLQMYDFSFKQQAYTGTFEMTKVNYNNPNIHQDKGCRLACLLCDVVWIGWNKKGNPERLPYNLF